MHVAVSHVTSSLCSDALKLSSNRGLLVVGKKVHSCMIKAGIEREQSLQNHLLNMYVKCESFDSACQLFEEMPTKRNVVSWNIMVSGFRGRGRCVGSLNKMAEIASIFCGFSVKHMPLSFFMKMLVEMVEPDSITYVAVIGACIELNDIQVGKQVHCCIMKSRFWRNQFVGSALVDLYAKCGFVEEARQVFDRIESRDLVLWNVLISCYNLNGSGREAFVVFQLMGLEGIMGNDFTFSSLLSACSSLCSNELGKKIHGLVIRLSYDEDILVASALIDMYSKCGTTEDARKAFDGMGIRNSVSWTTMIVGYGQNGKAMEAMDLFRQMLRNYLKHDELTMASLLSSCANLAATCESIQLHALVIKDGFESFLSIRNALINAYSKCGCIDSVLKIFSSISRPDLVTWTSIICAYAIHGLASEAIELFEKMMHEDVRPDGVIFVGVLSACSHAGLIEEGVHYFDSMRREHQIVPDSKHYTCLVDLLGRAGLLQEAFHVVIKMPIEPSADVLGAFIGACKVHGNIRLAKWAAEKLFNMEPHEPVNYMLMSNLYASVGSWREVSKVRKMMRTRCGNKVPGCSWVEIYGKFHIFMSNDKSHPQILAMYEMLAKVNNTEMLECDNKIEMEAEGCPSARQ